MPAAAALAPSSGRLPVAEAEWKEGPVMGAGDRLPKMAQSPTQSWADDEPEASRCHWGGGGTKSAAGPSGADEAAASDWDGSC